MSESSERLEERIAELENELSEQIHTVNARTADYESVKRQLAEANERLEHSVQRAYFVELYNAVREYKLKRFFHPLNDPKGKKYQSQALGAEDELFAVFDKFVVNGDVVESEAEHDVRVLAMALDWVLGDLPYRSIKLPVYLRRTDAPQNSYEIVGYARNIMDRNGAKYLESAPDAARDAEAMQEARYKTLRDKGDVLFDLFSKKPNSTDQEMAALAEWAKVRG